MGSHPLALVTDQVVAAVALGPLLSLTPGCHWLEPTWESKEEGGGLVSIARPRPSLRPTPTQPSRASQAGTTHLPYLLV